ncbi:Alphacrystallin B chainlike, partial [Caligus rogercresseyi]
LLSESDDSFQKRISVFKDKGTSLSLASGQPETAHNLQVSCSNDQFLIQLELPGFSPEDFTLKTRDDVVILEANHDSQGEVSTSRRYEKEFKMPEGVLRDQLSSAYTPEGILTITAPRKLEAPEGATIAEAMTAGSQAYTTDDGTRVAKDSQASSQLMSATTESPDGTTKSSMSFSSSSSSSSTQMSSSNMAGGGFPSISMGGGPSGDMSSMMQKMMSGMELGGGGGGSLLSQMGSNSNSSTQKSSFSSFSSSSSTVQESSSKFSSGIDSMMNPPLRMQMPSGLNIEEISNAGSDVASLSGNTPRYTVTSPPPTASELNHSVKGTSGKYSTSDAPDASILLKLKEGDEYKLVLNMQQFSPENIIVKLNDDRELSISAEENSEKFSQKHLVPEGIDLDALTSSFSSDGILVIKAPRKN